MFAGQHGKIGVRFNFYGFNLMGIDEVFFTVQSGYFYHNPFLSSLRLAEKSGQEILGGLDVFPSTWVKKEA
jgi:hypothetical protein